MGIVSASSVAGVVKGSVYRDWTQTRGDLQGGWGSDDCIPIMSLHPVRV